MTLTFGNLLDADGWTPMSPDQQGHERYFWHAGGLIADAPIDFAKTFDRNMFVTTQPIDVPTFNRNPLRVVPGLVVPRHYHNMDEMIVVFAGQYTIEHGAEGAESSQVVGPGDCFISRAGTPYTMIAGPEGVTYIETWPQSVRTLETVWFERGWVPRDVTTTAGPQASTTPVTEPGSIDFFDLLSDDGWHPLEGFDGNMYESEKIDRSFTINGVRCRPGFTVPRRRHNLDQLIVVIGGECLVEGDEGERRRICQGGFFVTDAGTPYTMTAGDAGVTYTEQWPEPVERLETYWYDAGRVHN